MKRLIYFLLSSISVWIISIFINYLLGNRLSFVYIKDGLKEIEHVGVGFKYLFFSTQV